MSRPVTIIGGDDRPLDLDRLHEAAVEAACELDRDYALRHPKATTYVRPGLAHELCVPGQPCQPYDWIKVWLVAPGVRGRTPA